MTTSVVIAGNSPIPFLTSYTYYDKLDVKVNEYDLLPVSQIVAFTFLP